MIVVESSKSFGDIFLIEAHVFQRLNRLERRLSNPSVDLPICSLEDWLESVVDDTVETRGMDLAERTAEEWSHSSACRSSLLEHHFRLLRDRDELTVIPLPREDRSFGSRSEELFSRRRRRSTISLRSFQSDLGLLRSETHVG